MNSMLEDVLAREGSAPAFEDSRVDAELEEMLSKMRTNIKIIGLGGGGCNTIGRVYNEGIVGAELYACNTDAQHLLHIASPKKVLLGRRITKGLGAGALPQIGEEAAREAEEELRAIVQGADIVFVTCGLGGGTGTGSCGYVARLAKEMGALTIAVVTLPFRGEGKLRMESAEWGLERLRDAADTVITIPNDKLLDLVPRQSLNLAFKFADEVLMRSIKGLTEIITKPGLVNLDFNDVKTIMKGGGVAMIGLGESQAVGDNRAVEAIEEAINSPLLEVDVSTAHGVLINVTGGNDMTISGAERVREGVQPRLPESPTQTMGVGAEDAELERILASLRTNIKIVGIGGGGCNTIDRLVESGIVGAELFAANTDAQHLLIIRSPHKLLLGRRVTRGLGAGALPQVGEESAREAADELRSVVQGADMVFITCGLGGGTGTGGAPVLAQLSKEAGALTIAICTFPFRAEGAIRAENAEYGLEKLRNFADTVVVIPNDKLLELVPRLALNAAFKVADDVLMRAIKGITEIITKPGLVNLDFNDIKTIMKGGGVAMIGLGESDRDNRSEEAIEEAINSPLIDVDISAATGALVNVTGGNDMSVAEAEKLAESGQGRLD